MARLQVKEKAEMRKIKDMEREKRKKAEFLKRLNKVKTQAFLNNRRKLERQRGREIKMLRRKFEKEDEMYHNYIDMKEELKKKYNLDKKQDEWYWR
jgi:hypothetical protein